ncbi:MAG: archaeosortase/exosortase family protein [Synechococcus sp.]|nr:archaeosortase/exosortase family protein [Synechococcus sp.]
MSVPPASRLRLPRPRPPLPRLWLWLFRAWSPPRRAGGRRTPWRLPPASPRQLWLLLALLVALQNCAVFHTSQNAQVAVLALLIWGGALICLEDQLETLRPRPGWIGLLAGSMLLLAVLARTTLILHGDGVLFALAPLAGLALALLCLPLHQLHRCRDPLLCLLLLPAYRLFLLLLPEQVLSRLTAQLCGTGLSLLGLNVLIQDVDVWLPGGGVRVAGPCSGSETIGLLSCTAVIFLLAFPLRSRWGRSLLLLLAPVIGLLTNTLRIAGLALLTTVEAAPGRQLFAFFHEDMGSLLFAGLAVSVYGGLYLRLLDWDLARSCPERQGHGPGPGQRR